MAKTEHAPLVLLVDDSEDSRTMYAEFFEAVGLRIAQAVDGDHGLWKILSLNPDVVVMDLAMPVLDGWEATREVRRRPKTRNIPVIVLTGQGTPENLERAKEAGADVVLVKPCPPDELYDAICGLLRR